MVHAGVTGGNGGRIAGTAVVLFLLAGCASLPERNPLPAARADKAGIPGIPNARYWANETPPYAKEWFQLPKHEIEEAFAGIVGKPHNDLAISAGGPNGAYGAGLLSGRTEAGDRPECTIVTGVSTGALIAPFAFLGSDYDGIVREMYTTMSTKDIFEMQGLAKAVFGEGAVDTNPLRQKIESHIDEEVVKAIAREDARGRSLIVITTNIGAGRPVAWNLGNIARSGSPQAV